MIPSIMELQSGTYKEFSEKFSKALLEKQGFEVSGEQIVFQQKGLNDLKFKERTTYARVMINTETGKKGEFRKLTAKIPLTAAQLKTLDAEMKNLTESGFKGMGMKILRWDGTAKVSLNGAQALKTSYLRQLNDNPSVYVEMYQIENNDRSYAFTISYRVADEAIWKNVLQTTKDSFKILAR